MQGLRKKNILYLACDGVTRFRQRAQLCANAHACKNLSRKRFCRKLLRLQWCICGVVQFFCGSAPPDGASLAWVVAFSAATNNFCVFCIWLGKWAAQCLACSVQALPFQRASAKLCFFPQDVKMTMVRLRLVTYCATATRGLFSCK